MRRWVRCAPVEEVVGDGFVDDHASLVPQDLLQRPQAVHHHHRVWIPQQPVQLIHNSGVWRMGEIQEWDSLQCKQSQFACRKEMASEGKKWREFLYTMNTPALFFTNFYKVKNIKGVYNVLQIANCGNSNQVLYHEKKWHFNSFMLPIYLWSMQLILCNPLCTYIYFSLKAH